MSTISSTSSSAGATASITSAMSTGPVVAEAASGSAFSEHLVQALAERGGERDVRDDRASSARRSGSGVRSDRRAAGAREADRDPHRHDAASEVTDGVGRAERRRRPDRPASRPEVEARDVVIADPAGTTPTPDDQVAAVPASVRGDATETAAAPVAGPAGGTPDTIADAASPAGATLTAVPGLVRPVGDALAQIDPPLAADGATAVRPPDTSLAALADVVDSSAASTSADAETAGTSSSAATTPTTDIATALDVATSHTATSAGTPDAGAPAGASAPIRTAEDSTGAAESTVPAVSSAEGTGGARIGTSAPLAAGTDGSDAARPVGASGDGAAANGETGAPGPVGAAGAEAATVQSRTSAPAPPSVSGRADLHTVPTELAAAATATTGGHADDGSGTSDGQPRSGGRQGGDAVPLGTVKPASSTSSAEPSSSTADGTSTGADAAASTRSTKPLIGRVDTRRLDVDLSDEGLGSLRLQTSTHAGALSVSLQAADPQVREAIARQSFELRRDLESAGIQLGSFDVSDGSPSHGQLDRQGSADADGCDHSDGSGERRTVGGRPATSSASTSSTTRPRAAVSGLDLKL